ncbi:hypothetical protein [Paenibacillus typhae]|uniref:hypothetical protein n=1 Tax=Paenibacillus typhae TaxID=1174501 RepID=UPI001C8DA38C|nr:hypothetical protein [Paenibacillus typhae]MBY0010977.1 hypothetical protein [Paenibacillus typhae]
MSYDVHITRAERWTESGSNPISLEEAKAYFADQEDFEYSSGLSVQGPFGTLAIDGDFFNWLAGEDEQIPFKHKDGRITVAGADDFVIEKMIEIAAGLGAKVQGDEGEVY